MLKVLKNRDSEIQFIFFTFFPLGKILSICTKTDILLQQTQRKGKRDYGIFKSKS